ncbi:hypothetical protein ERO13_D13G000540v2 [Gossypium hirsutum]|nr:hypothetical protein ERO13_D13G000540v2 [Gossypium hirsutum]
MHCCGGSARAATTSRDIYIYTIGRYAWQWHFIIRCRFSFNLSGTFSFHLIRLRFPFSPILVGEIRAVVFIMVINNNHLKKRTSFSRKRKKREGKI